jgi:hypothetical protein
MYSFQLIGGIFMAMDWRLLATLLITVDSLSNAALADNARDWQNTPIDLNMLFGYYNLVDTNTPIDTSLPIKGLSLNANVYILRYARSFDVDGRNTATRFCSPTRTSTPRSTMPSTSAAPSTTAGAVTRNWCSPTTSSAARR